LVLSYGEIFSSEEEKQRQENGGEVVQIGEKLPEGGKCIKGWDQQDRCPDPLAIEG
jgi:hypothetical protein